MWPQIVQFVGHNRQYFGVLLRPVVGPVLVRGSLPGMAVWVEGVYRRRRFSGRDVGWGAGWLERLMAGGGWIDLG